MRKKSGKADKTPAPRVIKFTRRTTDGDARLRQADRLARPLRLLKLLAESKRWTKEKLANELECSVKTVERSLKVLELAGIPLVHDAKSRTWRIQDNCLIPPVLVSAEESFDRARLSAVAEAQVQPAKLPTVRASSVKTVVSAELRKLVDSASALTSVLELKNVDHSRSAEVLRTLQLALAMGQQVQAEYFSPYSDTTSRITLHPYRLCFIRSAWYLIGRPATAESPQVYRVVRMQSLKLLNQPAVVPLDFSLDDFLGNAWGVFRGDTTYDVVITFSGSAAAVVTETRWHRTQTSRRNADGTVTLQFRVDGLDEFVWWLLSWAPFARVEQPVELRERLVRELESGLKANCSAL